MIYFTSDLHIGHAKAIEYCSRPFATVDEMNRIIVQRWNSRIGPHDTVYVLGDLTLSSYTEAYPWLSQLNGKKFLIKGNHDKFSISQYEKLGFTVFHEVKLKLLGKTVRLSHYPYAYPWWKRPFAYASELRFLDKRPPRIKGEILMHGHVHTKYKSAGNRIHVGVDAHNFYPVSLKELEPLIAKVK